MRRLGMRRLGILGSTRGTGMLAIISAIQEKRLNAAIEIVISNKPDAFILERARDYQLPFLFLDPKQFKDPTAYDKALSDNLKHHQVDLVVLIGYMRILSKDFVNQWRNQIINVHPSLLPDFGGAIDKSVHQAVLDSGKLETGCTIHYVTEEVDAGPVLIQKKCPVLPGDTAETLKTRVQQCEALALIEAIKLC